MTKNFKRSEFACKCGCGLDNIDPLVVAVWQSVRDHFGKPVSVTSGCRCETHNRKVGGVDGSQHSPDNEGITHAADGVVSGISPKEVGKYINSIFPNTLGVGVYSNFTHIDSRLDKPYRW